MEIRNQDYRSGLKRNNLTLEHWEKKRRSRRAEGERTHWSHRPNRDGQGGVEGMPWGRNGRRDLRTKKPMGPQEGGVKQRWEKWGAEKVGE